jgi:hypothetical protein
MNKLIIILLIIIIILLFEFVICKCKYSYQYKENYCNVPEYNDRGEINDKNVLLNYKPQSNIHTGNCDKYWKELPKESNSDMISDIPPNVQQKYIELPKQFKFADNSYKSGLIDFNELGKLVTDKIENLESKENISLNDFKELLLNPLNGDELRYDYEIQFNYDMLNKKTWIDRFREYNPTIKVTFDYNPISSPIENVNILNMEFIKRLNSNQNVLLNNQALTLYGIIPFQIFKYKIQKIEYNNNDFANSIKLYTIKICLFRESDLYINVYFYIGCVINGNVYITDVSYVGGEKTDTYLMENSPEQGDPKNYYILNDNYRDYKDEILNKSMDSVVTEKKKYLDSFLIKNQYACFNTNFSLIDNNTYKSQYILPNYTREQCESIYDFYGRFKPPGIFDRPCQNDEECLFYKGNKNYPNEFGKCGKDGKCQLPINMENLGFRYFIPLDKYKPLCYNCKTTKWNYLTKTDRCCDEQQDKEKYPFLNGPDYAYDGDSEARYNEYLRRECKLNLNGDLNCN